MLKRLYQIAWLAIMAVGLALAMPGASTAGDICELDPQCHEDLKKECDGEACSCFECDSEEEFCCLPPIED